MYTIWSTKISDSVVVKQQNATLSLFSICQIIGCLISIQSEINSYGG